jgi:hypothetical protein
MAIFFTISAFASDFPTPATFPVGGAPQYIAIADFNGDGKLDIATTTFGTRVGYVSILFGNGDRTFQAPVLYNVLDEPGPLVAADFNNDGHPDLVFSSFESGFQVMLNNGDGTFAAPVTYNVGSTDSQITAGDFNGDHFNDIAFSDYYGNVEVMLNNGNGTFAAPVVYNVGGAGFLITGDFNNDGKMDIAASQTNQVSILLGNGDGTFQSPISFANPRAGALAAADFNRDGKLDLVVAPLFTNTAGPAALNVYLGNGDGTFGPATPFHVDSSPGNIVVADFNADGIPDIATNNTGALDVSVLIGIGNGTFKPSTSYVASTAGSYDGIAAGVFGTTGRPDLVYPSDEGQVGQVALLEYKFTGFSAAINYQTGFANSSLDTGDFNGDGSSDIVEGHSAPLNTTSHCMISVSLNNGKGAFYPPTKTIGPISSFNGSIFVAAGDFNGDGKLDVAFTYLDPANQTSYIGVMLGHGDGTLTLTSASYTLSIGGPQKLFAADFNKDGKLDLITGCGYQLCLLLGNGDGTFAAPVQISTGTNANDEPVNTIAIGDINHDGNLDVVVTNVDPYFTAAFSVLLGNGDGTFLTPVVYTSPGMAGQLVLADLNGDGNLDLALNTDNGYIDILLGNGIGTFPTKIKHSTSGINFETLVAADFNGDGRIDLAGVTGNFYTFGIMHQLANGSFALPVLYPDEGNAAIKVGSFTSKGNADLAMDAYSNLTIYLNSRD